MAPADVTEAVASKVQAVGSSSKPTKLPVLNHTSTSSVTPVSKFTSKLSKVTSFNTFKSNIFPLKLFPAPKVVSKVNSSPPPPPTVAVHPQASFTLNSKSEALMVAFPLASRSTSRGAPTVSYE